MKTASLIAYIFGGIILVSFLIIVAFNYVDESDDARLASIIASYDADVDRLRVVLYLTDSAGAYTKVNGNLELSILQEGGREVYSNKYNFVKNDFVSWQSLMGGGKITGYIIDIRQFFPSGGAVTGMMEYNVYVDLNTKSGHWEDIYDQFWSFE